MEDISKKQLLEVELPEQLLKELLYVNYLINKHDEVVITETDDCIQTEFLCGGLWDKKKNLYGLTFYPNKTPDDFSWDIEITKKDIFAIAKGKTNKIKLWKCNNLNCNHYHAHENDRCLFCNPIDTAFTSQYSPEYIKKVRDEKQELLNIWKTQQPDK